MEEHPDLARGYVNSQDAKVASKQLWDKITTDCNSQGTPVRNVEGWKKVWSDYKFFIKKKLRQNKRQLSETGGGRCKQYSFSPLEEKVISLIDLRRAVDGINGAKKFGGSSQQEAVSNIVIPPDHIINSNGFLEQPQSAQPSTENIDDTTLSFTQTGFILAPDEMEIGDIDLLCHTSDPKSTRPTRSRKTAAKSQPDKYQLLKEQNKVFEESLKDISTTLTSLKVCSKENIRVLRKIKNLEEEKIEIAKGILNLKNEKMLHMQKESIETSKRLVTQIEISKQKVQLEQDKLKLKEKQSRCTCQK